MNEPRIGIITGLAFEAAIIIDAAARHGWNSRAPELKVAGIGALGAEAVAEEMAAAGAYGLVSFGVAGGLDPELAPGTLVIPDHIIQPDGHSIDTDVGWRSDLTVSIGKAIAVSTSPLVVSAQMLAGSVEKRALWKDTRACAVDMESAQIASAAQKNGLQFIAVRAVADDANTQLPPAARLAMDRDGHLQPRALLSSLTGNPGQIPSLIGLGLKSRRACASLRMACGLAGPSLALRLSA